MFLVETSRTSEKIQAMHDRDVALGGGEGFKYQSLSIVFAGTAAPFCQEYIEI